MKHVNKWYYSLKKSYRQLIMIISWIVVIVLGYLREEFKIESQIFISITSIIFVAAIYFTVLYFKSKKGIITANEESQKEEHIFKESIIRNSAQKELYNQLISNDFTLNLSLSNFASNLIIAALRQLKENPFFNKNDLSFDIDKRIEEFTAHADEQMRKSNKGTFVTVDIETTGLSTKTDRIVQISAVKVVDYKIVDTYESYIDPEKTIPNVASDIHGIYYDDVKDAPTFKEAFPSFEHFIEAHILVMHNSNFDYSIIKNECQRTLNIEFKRNVICTMRLWRNKYYDFQNEQAPSAKLQDIVFVLLPSEEAYDYNKNQHDALADAIATARIYLKML